MWLVGLLLLLTDLRNRLGLFHSEVRSTDNWKPQRLRGINSSQQACVISDRIDRDIDRHAHAITELTQICMLVLCSPDPSVASFSWNVVVLHPQGGGATGVSGHTRV